MTCASRRRGYLLLEVMISGVLAASILGSLMLAQAQMRLDSVKAARDASAAQLTQQRIEQLQAMHFDYIDVLRASSPINEVITMGGGSYVRVTTISAKGGAGCSEFPDAATVEIDCHDIRVDAQYVLKTEIRSVDATFRIYDPTP